MFSKNQLDLKTVISHKIFPKNVTRNKIGKQNRKHILSGISSGKNDLKNMIMKYSTVKTS